MGLNFYKASISKDSIRNHSIIHWRIQRNTSTLAEGTFKLKNLLYNVEFALCFLPALPRVARTG